MARNDFRQRVIFELVDQASEPAARIATSLGGIAKTLGALGAGALVTRAFGALTDFLQRGAEAAAEAETATVRLRAALENASPGAVAFAEALGQQAEQIQRLGLVSAEAVNGVQALLANLGVSGSQLQVATQASLDLSAALGVSLETAAAQVGKTVNGVTGRLGQLVPELAKLSDEALRAGDGIQLLADRFGGQAAQQADTYAASVGRLNEALQGTAEVIGASGSGQGVAEAVRRLAFSIEQANAEIDNSRLSDFFGTLKEESANFANSLVTLGLNLADGLGLLNENTAATREAAEASEAASAALQREARALEERATAQRQSLEVQTQFVDAVEKLGVALESEVNEEIEKNNELLLTADELYRRGVITRGDFERVSRAIGEAERELRAELTGTTEGLAAVETGYDTASVAAEAYRQRVQSLASASERATAASVGLGNALGIIARSSGSQALVDAAVAAGNRPTLGGTRIRVPGGSRLVGR